MSQRKLPRDGPIMLQVSKNQDYLTVKLTGKVDLQTLLTWEQLIGDTCPGHCLFLDLRDATHITAEAEQELVRFQRRGRDAGLLRTAVVVSSAMIRLQAERIARTSIIHSRERYISAHLCEKWKEVAHAWLVHGIEPSAFRAAVSHS